MGQYAKELHIIFSKTKTPRDTTFNNGNPFDDVTFYEVPEVTRAISGLVVNFGQGKEYFYPWHTIDRVRITEYDNTKTS